MEKFMSEPEAKKTAVEKGLKEKLKSSHDQRAGTASTQDCETILDLLES